MRYFLAFLLLTAIGSFSAQAQEEFDYVAGDLLVQVKPNSSVAEVIQDLAYYRGIATKVQAEQLLSEQLNIWLLRFDASFLTHTQLLAKAQQSKSIQAAQLNYIMQKRVVPNDTNYAQQWQYEQTSDADLDAQAAWDITTGGVTALGDTIVVCVIDDGIEVSHPDWGNNIWYNHGEIPNNNIDDDGNGYIDDYRGWNADANSNDILPPNPWNTHGTPVAGIVAAQGNNNIGVSGVNWDVKLMFVIGGGTNASAIVSYDYPLACRRLYNRTNGVLGAFVVATNASWGVNNQDCNTYSPLVNAMYDSLGMQGILNAAATANSNTDVDVSGDFPTTCTSNFVIGVTNIQRNNTKVTAAGYGATHIDLGAYGEGTYTIATGQTYANFGGTSAAAPHVAGAIGLLYAAPCQRLALLARSQPAQMALRIKRILLQSAVSNTDLQGITVSGGVLNLKNALDSVMNIGCSLAGCHVPYQVASTNTTGSSTLIHWGRVDSTANYYYRYRVMGTTNWIAGSVADTFVAIGGLMACSRYEIVLASDCDSSNYSPSFAFQTGDCCEPPTHITIQKESLTTANLYWSASALANSYTIEYKLTTDTSWTTTTTSMDSILLIGLDSCSLYECRILSTCATNINNRYSPIVYFNTSGCGSCINGNYCVVAGNNTDDDWLERVNFAGINHLSGNDNGYASLVNTGIAGFVNRGGSYPIDLDLGFNTGFWATNWRLKAWIDYNQDGVFSETTELVYDAGAINSATINHQGTVAIPNTATLGKTRMRVSMKWTSADVLACESPNYGEVEDYCITIATATNLSPLSISDNGLRIAPNPFNQEVTLYLQTLKAQQAQLQITTITGQVVLQKNANLNSGQSILNINTADFPTGIYLLQIQLADELLTKKIIKQ